MFALHPASNKLHQTIGEADISTLTTNGTVATYEGNAHRAMPSIVAATGVNYLTRPKLRPHTACLERAPLAHCHNKKQSANALGFRPCGPFS